MKIILILVIACCYATGSVTAAPVLSNTVGRNPPAPDAVKLSNISSLTLHYGNMTNRRSPSPVPQLRCVGGCDDFIPLVVQCFNIGWDRVNGNVLWRCDIIKQEDKAIKPMLFYGFDYFKVDCEVYSHTHDEYVLNGSCGVEYSLDVKKQNDALIFLIFAGFLILFVGTLCIICLCLASREPPPGSSDDFCRGACFGYCCAGHGDCGPCCVEFLGCFCNSLFHAAGVLASGVGGTTVS